MQAAAHGREFGAQGVYAIPLLEGRMFVEFMHAYSRLPVFARQKSVTARANCGCASQCTEYVGVGTNRARVCVRPGRRPQAFQVVGDAILDGHVVAGLEMQTRHMLGAAQ